MVQLSDHARSAVHKTSQSTSIVAVAESSGLDLLHPTLLHIMCLQKRRLYVCSHVLLTDGRAYRAEHLLTSVLTRCV